LSHGFSHKQPFGLSNLIQEAVDNTKAYGFINYFGQQRFGPGDGVTGADEIGLAMIQGNMVKAVQSLLKPSSKKDDTNDAKRFNSLHT
jgi:tRNA(Glu) U13 pseudouridine synthase TruD